MKPKLLLYLALVLSGGLCCSNLVFADATSAETHEVVAGNTDFAVDLFSQLRAQKGNLCFSPYSISTALAMTYGGARGETARQMARTLHFSLPPDQLHPAFAALEADLDAVRKKGEVQIAEANSLWPQKDFPFLPDYLALCRKYYGTSITPVDYVKDPEAARKTINAWVEAKTGQKIVELLKLGMVDRLTRLALVNAIYFKGKWASQFDSKLTQEQPFHLSLEKQVTAPLMHQTGDFKYAEFPGLQVLELPYAGDDLSMIVLLPRETNGLDHLEGELTAQNLISWTTNLQSQKVEVFLPEFKIISKFSLEQTLPAMGMPDAFNPTLADFSGMDGRKDLFIGRVVHQAFVKVNEVGTEAAAATAVVVEFGGAPRLPVFRADHPFLFLIRDNRDDGILFLGRVANPTQ
ncbi:MAG TPA: serpin family protein [Verrucomicrobiae bacterium]|nr:serpin family protein [Verrucomicrobiae bacterium]